MTKRMRKLHDDEKEKRNLLEECFGIKYNGSYCCSCCESSKTFPKPYLAFQHCFKLFIECCKRNESLKKEFSSTAKEILLEWNPNYKNEEQNDQNEIEEETITNNQNENNQQNDESENTSKMEEEEDGETNQRLSEIKPRGRESENPNRQYIVEKYVDNISPLDSRFPNLLFLKNSIQNKLETENDSSVLLKLNNCDYYEKCMIILETYFDWFVSNNKIYLFDELYSYISILKNSFGQNANGIDFQMINEIEEEIQIVQHMDKNISNSLIHVISKLFYLIDFYFNPSDSFKNIKTLQCDYSPMKINLENRNDKEMVWYFEFYITMLIISNNLSLSSFYILTHFLTFNLKQFSFKLERNLPSSSQTISRRIKEISFHFRNQLKKEIEDCSFFSLSYDCVRDSTSDKKFIGVTILLVDQWSRRKHFLLDFLPFSGNAITINNVIFSVFNSLGFVPAEIIRKKCISISTDNGGDCRKSRRTICEEFGCISTHCL